MPRLALNRIKSLLVLSASLSMACDPESTSTPEEMDMAPLDMGMDTGEREDMPDQAQDASVDLAVPEDLGPDLAPDMPEDMASGCEGECTQQDLTITFGAETRELGRAVYGLSAPKEEGDPWTIYLEALQGELEKCPEGPSSPDYTMIMSGVPIFEDGEAVTKQMLPDLNIVLFDFVGDLVPEAPFRTRADVITVSARALSVCEECVGMPAPSDEDGYVALTLEAQFPEGTISGNLYAVHCDILDRAVTTP